MKKVTKILSVIIILTIIISAFYSVLAVNLEGSKNFDIVTNANISDSVGESLEDDIMLIDLDEADSKKEDIFDDVYQIGETINITQNVHGNVYIISEKINIENANIDGNLFLIAEKINIKNTSILGSAYIIGDEVTFDSSVQDIYMLGNEVNIAENCDVFRTARIAGNFVNIAGQIGQNCYIDSEKINVESEAVINGVLDYSTKESNIDASAIVNEIREEIKEDTNVEVEEKTIQTLKNGLNVLDIVGNIFKAIILIGIISLVFKNIENSTKGMNIASFCGATVKGMAALIGLPILSIILLVTVLGAGIGVLLILVYIILLYISTSVTSLVLATNIVKENSKLKRYLIACVIFVIYTIISKLPYIGWIISFIALVAGLGYIFKILFYKEKKEVEVITESN